MSLPLNAAPKPVALASPILELRQYTLKPGKRETLIDLFDANFIEGQEDAGMTIIGQFRDLDRPDMFVWLRGFDSMEARKDALSAFYDGPIWRAHRDAANATMIDSDDVLLLRPAWPNAGFNLSGAQRADLNAGKKPIQNKPMAGILVIQIHHLKPGAVAGFASRYNGEAKPLMAMYGARPLAALVTEHAENSFPRLPVRSGENVFVSVTAFDSAEAHASHAATLGRSADWQALRQRAEADFARPAETLRLTPTARSLLK
ncbi:MAG: NIPSNAP family protein [Mesorhizobium sp.]|nr:NIPSNAP family protein [Mesorhizobium sp.]MBN9218437.1 NIPSNAP family protein [Mesorhizobium sp.]